MKITKQQLKRIIREEKAKILKESSLDDPGGAAIPPAELISRLEKIMGLITQTDGYLHASMRGDREAIEAAFEANGDVEYHVQQLLGELKGL